MPDLVGPASLEPAEVEAIDRRLDSSVPFVDPQRFGVLVERLGSASRLDPYVVVCELARCSPHVALLLRAGIDTGRRLYEHLQLVLDGVERDCVDLLPDPGQRMAVRLVALVRDSSRSLHWAKTASRFDRFAGIARRVQNALLATLQEDVLDPTDREAVRIVAEWDIIEHALQGRFNDVALSALRDIEWARRFGLHDVMLSTYVAHASAYSGDRGCCDADLLAEVAPTAPGAPAQFVGRTGRLTLAVPAHCRIVRCLLPDLSPAASTLLSADDESRPAAASMVVKQRTRTRGTWSATLMAKPASPDDLKLKLKALALEHDLPVAGFVDERVGYSVVTLVRDISREFSTPSIDRYENAVKQLAKRTGWARWATPAPDRGFTALLELREGHGGADANAADALAALFARYPALTAPGAPDSDHDLETMPATLFSARSVDGTVHWRKRPGFVISASADVLPHVKRLPSQLGLPRLVVADHDSDHTYEMRRER